MTILQCEICRRIEDMSSNPHFVCEKSTGYVVLGDSQFLVGYTVFLSKVHVEDINDLPASVRNRMMQEVFDVGAAVQRAFSAERIHYALLGREIPGADTRHVHWHIIPRCKGDIEGDSPLWSVPASIRNEDQYLLEGDRLASFVLKLRSELS